jgi:hypothetical protein
VPNDPVNSSPEHSAITETQFGKSLMVTTFRVRD